MKFAGELSDSLLEEVAMSLPLCFTSLVPPDLVVERIDTRGETILITASARRRRANCPSVIAKPAGSTVGTSAKCLTSRGRAERSVCS